LKGKDKKEALIVFAREPKEGKVKTRLLSDLSPRFVTRLYKAFLKDIFQMAQKVHCDERFIYYAGQSGSTPFLEKYRRKFRLRRQTGKDLGERMFRGFRFCLCHSFHKVIIIGTDCLTLFPKDIQSAYRALDHADCVLGPSKDGGYYLIGMKEPFSELFGQIDWSTSSVLKQTLKKAKQHKRSVKLLRLKEDIDTIASLRRLKKGIHQYRSMAHTHKILKSVSIKTYE